MATGLLAVALGSTVVWAGPRRRETSEDVDNVAIASVLVADGRYEQASQVLDELEKVPKRDEVQYNKLRGLIGLNLGNYQAAVRAFDDAVAAGAEPLVHVFAAQAKMGLEDYEGVIASLDAAREAGAGKDLPGTYQLRSRANQRLERPEAAYQALLDGREVFPEHPGLLDDQLVLLIELGLTRRALELAREALPVIDAKVETWVGLGDELRRAGALDEALGWLEETRLRFPDSVDAKVAVASACLDAELPMCCGEMLQEAAAYDVKYASDAAECFRRAGRLERAIYLNSLVLDDPTKVRQRLGLLLEQQDFAQAAALDARLSRLGILREEESVAYALAYAHYENGAFEQAEELLRTIRDPNLFAQATKLREAMQESEAGL